MLFEQFLIKRSLTLKNIITIISRILTKVEQDEILMEKGKDHANFPELKYANNPVVSAFRKKSL
jgi:hypothetical protein